MSEMPLLHEPRAGYVLCCCGDHIKPLPTPKQRKERETHQIEDWVTTYYEGIETALFECEGERYYTARWSPDVGYQMHADDRRGAVRLLIETLPDWVAASEETVEHGEDDIVERLLRQIRRQAHDVGWVNAIARKRAGDVNVQHLVESREASEVFQLEDDEILKLARLRTHSPEEPVAWVVAYRGGLSGPYPTMESAEAAGQAGDTVHAIGEAHVTIGQPLDTEGSDS